MEFGKNYKSRDYHLSTSKFIYYAQHVEQHIWTCFCIQHDYSHSLEWLYEAGYTPNTNQGHLTV